MKTLIKNARIISPGIDMPGAAVEMEGKTITAVYPAGSELPAADKVVDAEGRMLLPGFIDIHSHGAGGCDTCDAKLESLRTIAECKMKEGVTSWLPTTLTLSPKVLKQRNGRSRRGGTSLRHQDFRQGAVLAGLELHMGLVRLNVGQMVADFYEVPCFFDPSQDGAFVHGVGQAGHFNGNSHGGEC